MRKRFIAAALTAVFLFSAFSVTTAYAKGGPEEPECPYYNNILEPEPPACDPAPVVEEVTPPVERPFTPPGTGTVIDNVTDEDGKEFFTITSAAGNIFFLIIDRQRETENVYFLNAVTEKDLLAIAEESGDTWVSASAPPPIIPDTAPEPVEAEPEPEPDPEPEQSGGIGTVILLIVLILGGGAAGYYFKIYRPKQQGADIGDDFDYEDDYSDEADLTDPYSEGMEADTPPWDVEDEADNT